MGRLIDTDKLLKTLQGLEPHCDNKDYENGMLKMMRYYMPKIINDEPTAYDVDNITTKLEDAHIWLDEVQMNIVTLDDAIEIVKGGELE